MIRNNGWQTTMLSLVCFIGLMLGGCATSSFDDSTATEGTDNYGSFSAQVGNFDDIELPIDMKYVNSESMSIRTDSFEGGILAYSGRVEVVSLKQFIITSMENKKWKLAGEAKSEDMLLAFTKPSKTCMVVLEEGFGGKYGSTKATLYVTVDLAASEQLNPFGEPVSK